MGISVRLIKVSTPFFKNYVYVLCDTAGKTAALVDPVWDSNAIRQVLEEGELCPGLILLTHSHPDHTHLAGNLARDYNCPVYMSAEEINFYNFRCHNLQPAADQQTIRLGNEDILCMLTPGHAKGSMCYRAGDNLFTGDTLFIEGCGLCWGSGADPAAMFHTLQMLKQILHRQVKIYPGHSYGQPPGRSFACVLQNNIYLDFRNREDFIKYRMRKNQNLLFTFK